MKEFKGTPGPWSINHYYNWIESENADRVVIGGRQGFDADDAKLIAAAPELLEALQKILSSAYEIEHDFYGLPGGEDFDISQVIKDAKSAINKALGE